MKKKNNKKLLCKENIKILLYTLLFVFIDQITKFLVVKFITKKTIISGFLYLNYITNSGAAFSILSGNKIFLVLVSTILILYTINEVANDYSGFNLYGLLLILGGAIGNLIDRLFRGEVVDFISFKIFKYYFPIFNVADIFITIGVIVLLYSMLKKDVKNENRSRKRK